MTQDELKRFNPQDLSNSVWALVTSGLRVPIEFSKYLTSSTDFTVFSITDSAQLWTAYLYSKYARDSLLVSNELANKIKSELSDKVSQNNSVTITKTQKEIYNALKEHFQPKHIEMEKCIQQTLFVDIFMRDAKQGDIIIEVDGMIHQTSVKQKVTDTYKMEILNGMGYKNIVRIKNDEWYEVRNNIKEQVELLKKKLGLGVA